MSRNRTTLTGLARLGFASLAEAGELLEEVALQHPTHRLLPSFANAADPDQALRLLVTLLRECSAHTVALLQDDGSTLRLVRVLGASAGLGEFFRRNPQELSALYEPLVAPLGAEVYRSDLVQSVADATTEEDGWNALRVRYRHHLARLAAFDLDQRDQLAAIGTVTAALSDLAGAAIDASLAVARAHTVFPAEDVSRTKLAVIGMGKAGARELNYVSDVDVIFVAEGVDGLDSDRAVHIATKLAMQSMRGIHDFGIEPALWEVDANLRPEGKDGALVRTLESHLAYYDRWAKSWEFQALLKARTLAGDSELADRYVSAVGPKIWSIASRENFVQGVQRMRERVTANIPADDIDVQLKLGPGGLRDIEFTIQLLQLVHGQNDEAVRQRDTLGALVALADQGYIGRTEAASFSRDYRFLRLLEHRLQLSKLSRTHLMPRNQDELRILARATGLFTTAEALTRQWQSTKIAVRSLHERLFYRPLLSAVASLPDDESLALTSGQAVARLAASGFIDAKGALGHIRALTTGVSRRAQIQRTLLPVMLQWFADGADPDYGLLAFRRLSDDLGESHWFLRMLRDSSGAAKRLTHVLSGSRFVGVLLEVIPESVAWLENEEELRPRSASSLREETAAIVARHENIDAVALALRTARRREVLRLALGAILDLIDVQELGRALSDITTTLLTGLLSALRRQDDGIEFGIVAMGRYGGRELGFGSDADVMYVYRPKSADFAASARRAEQLVSDLLRHTEDLRLPLDLDINLRPEGKNGPVVRSLDSYRAYYARWSLTWEAQALLRARGAIGDAQLLADFDSLADQVRFPAEISEQDVREVKRIKARVESERLPQAADPARHLKLGRGSLSDVEWFVQLIQLQHGAKFADLRTTSTLDALSAAVSRGLVEENEAATLRDAWVFATRARSAMTLWRATTSDVLPRDRQQLEGVARIMGYAPGSASQLEDDYLRATRHARVVFERRFYGETTRYEPTVG
ncbi:MAG: bifunctional glutamine-synthetase adenylyltransferase/deadenyltransferase [Homoserinimonas sp.]|nr:bifunctional glutamine-synthetase adenylyltransferase/deadenyltransferase [Homoserinimonas sp.]